MCSACHLGVLGVDQHRNTSFVGVTQALCVSKPVFLEHGSKWRLGMKPLAAKQSDKVTPENEAVYGRYGDQCGHP